jgi:Na+:H+ antiporter, NhaA family
MDIQENKSSSFIDIGKNQFHQFLESNIAAGVVLIVCTIIAILWSNSLFSETYDNLWHTELAFRIGSVELSMHLSHWVNDALMAIFFFVVGLEIKREVIDGELSTVKKAALPVFGALGGMILPAAIFLLLNYNQEGSNGWGVPMATDIAFSLGILNLLGKRVPVSLKIFLVALAIVDDLGAISVIAIFYSADLQLQFLVEAASLFTLLILLNWLNVRHLWLYAIIGILIWYFFLQSGIHATVAGVLIAMTIPIKRGKSIPEFNEKLKQFKISESGCTSYTLTDKMISKLDKLESEVIELQSPLQRTEHMMHKVINFFIMPVFALANAGVHISGTGIEPYTYIGINIAVALFIGKSLGITLFVWLSVKMKFTELPDNLRLIHFFGVAILGGIGFTMSLFISNLAFSDQIILDSAKLGILVGSFIASVTGYFFLSYLLPKNGEIKESKLS